MQPPFTARRIFFFWIILCCVVRGLHAAEIKDEVPAHRVVERGAHHRVWQRDEFITLNDGRVINRPHRVIERATGLHYLDAQGQWAESREEIEITPTGAQATRSRHPVQFAANANTQGAIALTTPDGQAMRSHVLGLIYTDAATGRSVWVAQIQDSLGELFPPNQVLYPAALAGEGLVADLRYSHTRAGFEQDVILGADSKLPAPSVFNMSEDSTWLQVCTEWIAAPEPRVLPVERAAVADASLDFGTMRMTRGGVFALDAPVSRMSITPVGKQWVKDAASGRTYLIESVPFKAIRDELEKLKNPQASIPKDGGAPVSDPASPTLRAAGPEAGAPARVAR